MNKSKTEKSYFIWKGMFRRCYSPSYHSKKPTYKDCIVHKDWWDYPTFKKWFDINYIEDYHLDKDILIKGNKIYSSETCCFVPRDINQLFTKSNTLRGELPIGVVKRGNRFRSMISKNNKFIHLGYYNTSNEAFQVYKMAKEEYILENANKWKSQISENVYNAMCKYIIEITD